MSVDRSIGHESLEFTVDDMELLHHFTTATCPTISTDPLVRNFWRVSVPQMGFTTRYLLHGILSIAALHLAHSWPERRDKYINQANRYHNASLASASPLIANVGENLILFSHLMSYFALAKPKDSDDFLVAGNRALPEWLYVFRGMRVLMHSVEQTKRTSSILELSGSRVHKVWTSKTFDNQAFRDLEMCLQRQATKAGDPSTQKVEILMDAARDLKRSFAFFHGGHDSVPEGPPDRATFVWLYMVSDEYFDLVKDGDNEALCILAFFCVLLRRLDHHWWVEGWGFHLIQRIYSLLDDEHRLWVRWPIEEIGWIPGY